MRVSGQGEGGGPEARALSLGELLNLQRDLQIAAYGVDPSRLTGEERAEYVRWNVLALEDELHEAMQEVKWKPWLTEGHGDWVDRDAYVKELVDALHFILNLINLALGHATCEELGAEVTFRYLLKRERNARRQVEGYSGDKDESGRELDDPDRPPVDAHRRAIAERHQQMQHDVLTRLEDDDVDD